MTFAAGPQLWIRLAPAVFFLARASAGGSFVWAGMSYAFPRAFAATGARYPGLAALAKAVAARPNIARYLASGRRIPFNESGVFRHYPELDAPAKPAGA